MAIDVELGDGIALVTGEPRERQTYTGSGDARTVSGRLTDGSGRPVSGVSAVVFTESLGLLAQASVLVPDSQASALSAGAVVRLDGKLSARLVGADFGAIRASVTAERVTPLGDAGTVLRQLADTKPAGTKSEGGRAA